MKATENKKRGPVHTYWLYSVGRGATRTLYQKRGQGRRSAIPNDMLSRPSRW